VLLLLLVALAGGVYFVWTRLLDDETRDRLMPASLRDSCGGAVDLAVDSAANTVGWLREKLGMGDGGVSVGGEHFQPLAGGDEFDVDEEDVDGPMQMR